MVHSWVAGWRLTSMAMEVFVSFEGGSHLQTEADDGNGLRWGGLLVLDLGEGCAPSLIMRWRRIVRFHAVLKLDLCVLDAANPLLDVFDALRDLLQDFVELAE